jgi:hypothetical protein
VILRAVIVVPNAARIHIAARRIHGWSICNGPNSAIRVRPLAYPGGVTYVAGERRVVVAWRVRLLHEAEATTAGSSAAAAAAAAARGESDNAPAPLSHWRKPAAPATCNPHRLRVRCAVPVQLSEVNNGNRNRAGSGSRAGAGYPRGHSPVRSGGDILSQGPSG